MKSLGIVVIIGFIALLVAIFYNVYFAGRVFQVIFAVGCIVLFWSQWGEVKILFRDLISFLKGQLLNKDSDNYE